MFRHANIWQNVVENNMKLCIICSNELKKRNKRYSSGGRGRGAIFFCPRLPVVVYEWNTFYRQTEYHLDPHLSLLCRLINQPLGCCHCHHCFYTHFNLDISSVQVCRRFGNAKYLESQSRRSLWVRNLANKTLNRSQYRLGVPVLVTNTRMCFRLLVVQMSWKPCESL